MSLFGARRYPRTAPLPVEGRLPAFDGATGWLNSSPLTPAELRGRVVLVDFWTYTCINWLRTLAFAGAWAAKYRDLGLVVIGVHTPEFPFEREVGNVREAVEAMRVEYPVALDSDYGVWSAFANRTQVVAGFPMLDAGSAQRWQQRTVGAVARLRRSMRLETWRWAFAVK